MRMGILREMIDFKTYLGENVISLTLIIGGIFLGIWDTTGWGLLILAGILMVRVKN